jgi:phosphoribosylaminoimidazole-succinocarboxamide synthase
LEGIPGVPAVDDVNITRANITENFGAFNFESLEHVDIYERLLAEGFSTISAALEKIDQVFVDTKFGEESAIGNK